MLRKLKYLIRSINSVGLKKTVDNIIFGYLCLNKFMVLRLNLETPFRYVEKNQSLKMTEISLEDLHRMRDDHPGLPIEFYCDEIQGFSKPYVAFINNEIAAIHWLTLPGENSRFLTIRENDAELNYNTVLPQFRGKGVAKSLMAYIIQTNNSNELENLWGVVHIDNIPQWKPMIKLGFDPVGIITHWAFHRPKISIVRLRNWVHPTKAYLD